MGPVHYLDQWVFRMISKIRWISFLLSILLGLPVQAALVLEGKATQGGWMIAHDDNAEMPILEAQLDGKPLLISSSGYLVFGFGRDAGPDHLLTLRYHQGVAPVSHPITVTQRRYNIQRIEGIEPRIMTPSAEDLVRIDHEAAAVQAARKIASDRQDFLQQFHWPAKGPISGVYGSQRVYNGVPKNPHMGLDIAAPKGAWIKAPIAGKVVFAEPDLFYSGGTVILDHGLGLFSTYIHMEWVAVNIGDELKQGDHIGKVGAKGRASGPHLHWGMSWFEERLDPQLWLPSIESKE